MRCGLATYADKMTCMSGLEAECSRTSMSESMESSLGSLGFLRTVFCGSPLFDSLCALPLLSSMVWAAKILVTFESISGPNQTLLCGISGKTL